MNIPMSERVQQIADIFFMISESVDETCEVHMSTGHTPSDSTLEYHHYCGTTACHAGWFEIFTRRENPVRPHAYGHYKNGVSAMRNIMGIEPEVWADRFPHLWGNDQGYRMFGANTPRKCFIDEKSNEYHSKSDDPITLNDIANHWQRVALRVAEAEAKGQRVTGFIY